MAENTERLTKKDLASSAQIGEVAFGPYLGELEIFLRGYITPSGRKNVAQPLVAELLNEKRPGFKDMLIPLKINDKRVKDRNKYYR